MIVLLTDFGLLEIAVPGGSAASFLGVSLSPGGKGDPLLVRKKG